MARQRQDQGTPKDWSPLDGHRELVANLGDQTPLDYGGYLIYKHFGPDKIWYQGAHWEEPVHHDAADSPGDVLDSPGLDIYEVRRWTVEDDVLEDLSWVDADQLKDVAASVGASVEDLESASKDPDPLVRASLYRDIGDHFGLDNLDAYPQEVDRHMMGKWFPEIAR